MTRRYNRKRGVFITEAVTALVLTGLVLGGVSMATLAYRRANERFTAQRRMQLAIEGLIEKYRAGAPIPSCIEEAQLAGGISLHAESSPGQGMWQGLTRVDVVATMQLRNRRESTYRSVAYFPSSQVVNDESAGGGDQR